MKHIANFIFLVIAFFAAPAFSHGGGLNADGCHTNRKTGLYHCHKSNAEKKEEEKAEADDEQRNRQRGEWNGENEWTQNFCPGNSQHVNTDGTRTDCLTDSAAIEVDFPDKWAEAHGQAIRYRRINPNRTGEIWILCGRPKRGACEHHIPRLLADTAETGIVVRCFNWTTGNKMICPGADSVFPVNNGRQVGNAAKEVPECEAAELTPDMAELRRLRRTVDVLLDKVLKE